MTMPRRESQLHLQMGQEVIYLILAISVITAFMLIAYVLEIRNAQGQNVLDQLATIRQERAALEDERRERAALEDERRERAALEEMCRRERQECQRVAEQLEREIQSRPLPTPPPTPTDKPPIIILTEAKGYYFASGSAELSHDFQTRLKNEVIPRLVDYARRYRVEIVEIIGHTDELPVRNHISNLDKSLLPYLNSNLDQAPAAADNVGLGMARAAAVARELIDDPRIASFRILPLSAGQTIEVDETLAKDGGPSNVKERRRIEIRMRRLE